MNSNAQSLTLATVLTAQGLMLTGILLFTLPCSVDHHWPLGGPAMTWPISVVAALLGVYGAIVMTGTRIHREVLIIAWMFLPFLLKLSLDSEPRSSVPHLTAFGSMVIYALSGCVVASDLTLRRNISLFLAYFLAGCLIGIVGFSVGIELHLDRAYWLPLMLSLMGAAGIAFTAALWYSSGLAVVDEPTGCDSPTWLRRFRWAALSGLSAGVATSVVTYVSAEISPIPLFWFLLLLLYLTSWILALAEPSEPSLVLAAWIAKGLAHCALGPLLWHAWELDMVGVSLAWLPALIVVVAAPVLIPHRFTLIVQSSLLAIVLLQIILEMPVRANSAWGPVIIIMLHLLACTMTFAGCHSDVVSDAPAPDRTFEFLLFTVGGAVLGAIVFLFIPDLLFARWSAVRFSSSTVIEYPLALIACVVVRAVPWPIGARKSPAVGSSPGLQ